MSLNAILRKTTAEYIANLDRENLPSPEDIEEELLQLINSKIKECNAIKSRQDKKHKELETLPNSIIADVLLATNNIAKIDFANEVNDEHMLLTVYQTDGIDRGIYVSSSAAFKRIVRPLNYTASKRDIEEVCNILYENARIVKPNTDKDLIAVNNGIFNYATKTLQDFDPDIVFISKSHIDYNPGAQNITIHNDDDNTDWDVESWMQSLSDDPEIVSLLWEILSAIIRPNVRWNKSAWLYSEQGNNGKGTLCELMRALCGAGSYASIPISAFGQDFMLEPLTRATAIIVDENDVGSFIDKAANLKAVITNDVIQINRKFRTPINFRFYGFMVQCLNDRPRIKDKTNSMYRRLLIVPLTKCFTGKERKYIKNEYLHNKDVLEYVLYKVLNTNFYTLSEPQACKNELSELSELNNPVKEFMNKILSETPNTLIPTSLLYDGYKAFLNDTHKGATPLTRKRFKSEVNRLLFGSDWEAADKPISTCNRLVDTEPIVYEYPYELGKYRVCNLGASSYRGIFKRTSRLKSNTDSGNNTV